MKIYNVFSQRVTKVVDSTRLAHVEVMKDIKLGKE